MSQVSCFAAHKPHEDLCHAGDLTVTRVYAGKKTPADHRRKVADSLTCLLGHKHDTVPSSVAILG